MKKIFYAALLILILNSCAHSEIKEFKRFSIDVPEDWTSTEYPDADTVSLIANDKTSSMSITITPTGGTGLREIAGAYMKELKATDSELNPDGAYIFQFNNGLSHGILRGFDNGDYYMLVVLTGINNDDDPFSKILSSLEIK